MMAVTRADTACAPAAVSPSVSSIVTSPATTRTRAPYGGSGSTCASAITSSTEGSAAIVATRIRPREPDAPVTRITEPLTVPSGLEQQARPAGAESEREQQEAIAAGDPAAVGRIFQVDEVVGGDHVAL